MNSLNNTNPEIERIIVIVGITIISILFIISIACVVLNWIIYMIYENEFLNICNSWKVFYFFKKVFL